MKNHCGNKSKASITKAPLFTSTQDFKLSKKARTNKKKKKQKDKYKSNLNTKVNITKIDNKKNKKKNINHITYYNYDKKRHYGAKYRES